MLTKTQPPQTTVLLTKRRHKMPAKLEIKITELTANKAIHIKTASSG